MKPSTLAAVSLFALLVSCAASRESIDEPVAPVYALDNPSASDGDPAVHRGEQEPIPAASHHNEMRLSDPVPFRDPEFRRKFSESYVAETAIEPKATSIESEVIVQIIEMINTERLDEARSLIEKNRGPASSAIFDFLAANLHLEGERIDDAAAAYERAVQKYPKFRRAWQMLGEIYVRQGNYTQAVAPLTEVIKLGGGDGFTFGALGVAQANNGNAVAAESAFRMASMHQPERKDWKLGLAESFFKQGRFADAAAQLDELLREMPDRADLWRAQGDAYAMLGQPLKAAQNYEVVDRMGGATVDTLNNLGDIYAKESLYELAVSAYLRALERSPDAKLDRGLRAAAYLSRNGALRETRLLCDGITELRPDVAGEDKKALLKVKARLAVADGAGAEEAEILREIVELDPLDGEALIMLGVYHRRVEEPERAIAYFDQAAGLDAHEAEAKLQHGQLFVSQGRYAEALPLLRRSQQLKPRQNVQEFIEQVEKAAQSSR